ncbi:MAG: flagellar basal body P-ring formation protein FlgA [Alphaproteobacteria bacterium]|nr:flagellar basal body P-ring formation protein FlgA [Alphaproteobacteria bacterium]
MKAIFLFLVALMMAYPAFADSGVRIVVPARDIARGETISETDLTYAFVAPENALPGTVSGMDTLLGKQTRRVLRAGESVRADDVRQPILVAKGQTVTMVFEAPGVVLTATGKAMSEGGLGESVTVLNPVSYRQVTAIVTGQGAVKAQAGFGGLPSRVASNIRPGISYKEGGR